MVKPLANSVHQSFSYGSPQHVQTRKSKDHAASKKAKPSPAHPLALSESERTLLSLLSTLSAPTLADPTWLPSLQELKAALYNKEYEKAFGGEDSRRVYAARWVPSHALVFRKIFAEMGLRDLLEDGGEVVFLGGGSGSEVVALGSLLSTAPISTSPVRITTYDIIDWSSVLTPQFTTLSSATPSLNLTLTPLTHDVLSLPLPAFPANPTLITLLFTASELFSQSRPSTLALLAYLSATCPSGTHLLVVESAALVLVPVGTATYPMDTLLDHALGKAWEVQRAEANQWLRMPEGAAEAYPIKLENTRVLLRLYQKI